MFNTSAIGRKALGRESADFTQTVTGESIASAQGDVTTTVAAAVDVAGFEALIELGQADALTSAIINVPGFEIPVQQGDTMQVISTSIVVLGMVGNITQGIVMVPQTVVIEPVGLEITGEQGTVGIGLLLAVPVTGVEATGELGTAAVSIGTVVPIVAGFDLLSVTSQGVVNVPADMNLPVSGLEFFGSSGVIDLSVSSLTAVTGLPITAEQGNAGTGIGSRVPVLGFMRGAFLGDVEVFGDIIPVPVTGVAAIGQTGNAVVDSELNALVIPDGLEITGIVDNVLVWGQIPGGPDGQWVEIVT